MSTWLLLLVYCTLILLVSLAGGLVPLKLRMTHRRMQLLVSLVAGVMLGVGLLHMLPHALIEAPGQTEVILMLVLAGILSIFFIERFFCFHHHDAPNIAPTNGQAGEDLENHHHHHHHHDHKHSHVGARDDVGDISHEAHHMNWVGAATGLILHTIIAGIALAASVEAGSQGDNLTAVAGFGTFFVIFLHKPFDAMTITTLMTMGRWRRSTIHIVNALFALVIPLGVVLFYLGLSQFGENVNLVAYALAFSAGAFLSISLSDLLPELQFHAHDRTELSASLIFGLSISVVVSFFEPGGHDHEGHGRSVDVIQYEHEGGNGTIDHEHEPGDGADIDEQEVHGREEHEEHKDHGHSLNVIEHEDETGDGVIHDSEDLSAAASS
ncbi:MAG: ZIP family metal transporter [gamma proteobacterium symbiont of Taylorina sp.]|nr:ZIP family metal transporter [gamma proteobacterium symbiont of Taylorina sp.]